MEEVLNEIMQFWDQWWFLAEVLTLIALLFTAGAALITAGAAWRSAVASRRAADETRVATTAQIMSSLLGEYSSAEMSDAMTRLQQFEETHGCQLHHRFLELRGEDRESYERLNAMRRRMAHYFDKIYRLQRAEYIDDAFVRTVVGQGQVEFYLKVIEPLEKAIDPAYDKSAFEYFAKLHGLDRRVGE